MNKTIEAYSNEKCVEQGYLIKLPIVFYFIELLLLFAYCVPDPVLGSENLTVNRINIFLPSWGFLST